MKKINIEYTNYLTMFSSFLIVLILITACMVIFSRNIFNAVLTLILMFILAGILLITMGLDFLGLLLIIVYVGAILVLFIFVIMLLGNKKNPVQKINWNIFFYFLALNFIILALVYTFKSNLLHSIPPLHSEEFIKWTYSIYYSSTQHIYILGTTLYIQYGISLIFMGLLLLVALIICILFSLRLTTKVKAQAIFTQEIRTKHNSITLI